MLTTNSLWDRLQYQFNVCVILFTQILTKKFKVLRTYFVPIAPKFNRLRKVSVAKG